MRKTFAFMVLAALASPLGAQSTELDTRIREILDLPRTVDSGRRAGIPDDELSRVLDSLRRRRVPADDAEEILRREIDLVRGGQPKDNFGAFVNEQLARGLRGRELANAIHEEQARRGTGASRERGGSAQGSRRPDAPRATPAGPPEEKGRGKGTPPSKSRDDRKEVGDTGKGQGKGRRP